MAAPISSTRRVLSDLNVNLSPSKGTALGIEKLVSSIGISKSEVGVVGLKRSAQLAEDHGRGEGPNKRFKSDGANIGARPRCLPEEEEARMTAGINAFGSCSPRINFPASPNAFGSHLSSPASSISPMSSNGSNGAANDSQNTIFTEPDSPGRIMAPSEIRQKARAMKLRLRLASYKVQTNQIDLPISQLQIKTAPPSPTLPALSRPSSANTSQRRTPLPSNIPNINLQKASAEKSRPITTIPSSPPRPFLVIEELDGSPQKDSFATPHLPRQRHGLLAPTTVSPMWKGRGDLTSSVVKKHAADSLLTLGRADLSISRSF